jgi:hypothetical protein
MAGTEEPIRREEVIQLIIVSKKVFPAETVGKGT